MSDLLPQAAQPSAAAAAAVPGGDADTTEADLLPVLPKGDALFDNIPARAVVLEELAPALGDGLLVVRGHGKVGVVLIRERALFESYCYAPDQRLYGAAATDTMKSWDEATVSAYRLEPELVDICPSLLRGETLYGDLRLNWTNWQELIADLSARDGNFVVEIRTPGGRGVTCLAHGRQIATFTEAHPDLGPPSLLDQLTHSPSGSIWVHCEPAILDAQEWAATQIEAKSPPRALPPASIPMPAESDVDENPFADSAAAANPFASMVSQATAAAPQRDTGSGVADITDVHVGDVHEALKDVARNRLQRSAARVETMIDDAAESNQSLADLLDQISGLVIRGVMQSTIEEMVDEMREVAAHSAA